MTIKIQHCNVTIIKDSGSQYPQCHPNPSQPSASKLRLSTDCHAAKIKAASQEITEKFEKEFREVIDKSHRGSSGQ